MGNAHFNGAMDQYVLYGGSTVKNCSTEYINGCTVWVIQALTHTVHILQALTVRIITTVLARADCPAFLAQVAIICTTTLPAIQFIATAK